MIKAILSWLQRTSLGVMLLLPLAAAAQTSDKPFSNEQLDQMLAQIALYPDSLLSQVLMAATYPEDFAKAAAWSKAHPEAKGDSAVKMVESEPWDPSVASLVAFPEVLIALGEKPDYVRNLGDAFLAQPEDVMDSAQRLRAAAQKAGNLSSNEQIKVSSQAAPAPSSNTVVVVQQAAPPPQVIVIEPAQPQVVYVPAYNPTLVYGPWWYPSYPPYYYPPPPGYWFSRTVATGIAWGVGIGISNALWGGFDWGRRDVNINVNRYNNINVNRKIDVDTNRTTWNHDPGGRGDAPYRGGDATRQQLEKKRNAGNREAYRGKEAGRDAGRDSSRQNAAQAMQDRSGGKAPSQARDAGANREPARQKAGAVDRDEARQRAQTADRDAARQRTQQSSKDNVLKGVNDRDAGRQIDRGTVSHKSATARPNAAKAPAARPAASMAPAAKRAAAPATAAAGGGNKGGRGR